MAGTSPPPQGIAHVCIPSVKQMDIKRMKRYDSKASWGRQLRSFLCLTIEQLVQIEGCVFASCHQATSGCAFPTHLRRELDHGDYTETIQRRNRDYTDLYSIVTMSMYFHVFPTNRVHPEWESLMNSSGLFNFCPPECLCWMLFYRHCKSCKS